MHPIFLRHLLQIRWIAPYIAPFLCSLLWFCCKPFAPDEGKPPNVGLCSCLPVPRCEGRACTCRSPMQSEGSVGTKELGMLQSVLNWKKQWLKPTTERIPEPAQCHRALLLSVQCVFATCLISLTHFSSALLDQGASLTWKEVVRDRSDPRSSTLDAICSWKWKATWGGNLLACILPQCTAIHYS